jgi:hypothetical protein
MRHIYLVKKISHVSSDLLSEKSKKKGSTGKSKTIYNTIKTSKKITESHSSFHDGKVGF